MIVPNVAAALILASLLIALTAVTLRIAPGAALPAVIHNLLWAVTVVLVGSDLIEYRESSIVAWATLFAGLLFFNVGAWVGSALAKRRNGQLGLLSDTVDGQRGLIGPRGLAVLLGLYGVGFVVYLRVIHTRFGISTLITNPGLIRADPDSYLASVPLWARLLMYIGPLLLALLLTQRGFDGELKLAIRIFLIVGLALSMVALLQRTNLFIGATWALAAILMAPPGRQAAGTIRSHPASPDAPESGLRSRGARGLVVSVVLAAGLFVAFQVVGGALGKAGDAADGSGTISPLLQETRLTGVFRYMTTGVPAFLLLTESTNQAWPPTDDGRVVYGDYNPQTWGAATFEPVVSLIPDMTAWNPVNSFVDVGVLTNVYTWLEPFYRDFREVGVVLGAALLGTLITYLYATRHWSARRFWTAALFLSMVFLSTFVPKVNSTPYLFGLLLVIAVSSSSTDRYRPRSPFSDAVSR